MNRLEVAFTLTMTALALSLALSALNYFLTIGD